MSVDEAAAKVIEEALGREMLLSGGYFRNTDDVIAENIMAALAAAGFDVVRKATGNAAGTAD